MEMAIQSTSRSKIFALLLVIVSWGAYTYAVLASHHLDKIEYAVERGLIASSISNILYKTPIGGAYDGVNDILKQDKATAKGINAIRADPQQVEKKAFKEVVGHDGFALGFVYNLGMRLFGVNINAVFLIFSLLVLISHLTYTLRFNDYRFIIAPISLLALMWMFFSPLAANTTIVDTIPMAGYRYFTVLAALPVIHISLELLDSNSKFSLLSSFCLIIQTVLIGLCGFIAKSGAYAFVAIFLLCILDFYTLRRNKTTLKLLIKKIGFVLSILTVFSVIFYSIMPIAYKQASITTDAAWHRVWISLGASPEWPFKGIKEQYAACTGFADNGIGLHSGIIDGNGECVWREYVKKHPFFQTHHPVNEQVTYQAVQRDEFLRVMFHYPVKTFITFFYYKPLLIVDSVLTDFGYDNPSHELHQLGFLIISAIVLIVAWFFYFTKYNLNHLLMLFYVLFLLMLSTISMYIVAWANFGTIAELMFCLYALVWMCLTTVACLIKTMIVMSLPCKEASPTVPFP